MVNNIVLWTEGGVDIGMGHVVRSVNLASALSRSDSKPSFIINADESARNRLLMEGFTFFINSFDSDFTDASLDVIAEAKVVVMDTKKDVTKITRLLKAKGIKVVLIDNTTLAANYADLIIIPSILPVDSGIDRDKLFSGADFLILGDNFIEARGVNHLAYATPLRVLVTFGGADPFGLTSLVVDSLCSVEGIDVTVVIGEAFTKRDPYAYAGGCKHVRCVSGLTDLAPLMKESHVAFTANGTSIYELAYMGVPSLLIANYESDIKELQAYGKFGFSTGLGLYSDVTPGMISSALMRFADKKYFESCSKKALSLTDGHGAKRAAEVIVSLLDSV